jgi:hypothetical protein
MIGGVPVFVRAHLGVFTQPLSFTGLPVISVPVARPGPLPIGVQLVAAPWSEATLFRVAPALEAAGVVTAPVAPSPPPADRTPGASLRRSRPAATTAPRGVGGLHHPSWCHRPPPPIRTSGHRAQSNVFTQIPAGTGLA